MIPIIIIGRLSSCPLVIHPKKSKPIVTSGARYNSTKNLKLPYSVKNKPPIKPVYRGFLETVIRTI